MSKHSKNYILLISIIIILSLILAFIGIYSEYVSAKFESQKTEIILLKREIQSRDREIELLNDDVDNANKLIAEINNMFHQQNLTLKQVQKSFHIAKETPLTIDASLSLVKYCDRYNIDYSLILGLIETESNFQPNLISAAQDRGLMQIIPDTEKLLADRYGEELGLTYNPRMIFEPSYNLALGIKYLSVLLGESGDDMHKAISLYNRGPFHLKRYYERNGTYATGYSKKVLSKMQKYKVLDE